MLALTVSPVDVDWLAAQQRQQHGQVLAHVPGRRPKLYPYMSSITILCDRPMPSVSRPPRATDAVIACWAMTAGCRG